MNKREILESVLARVIEEENNNNRHLPMVRSPQAYSLERARERKGILGSLLGYLDPQRKIESRGQLERIEIENQTKTDLLKIDGGQAIEIAKIRSETSVEDYMDKAALWLEGEKRRNRAAQALIRYKDFRQFMEDVIDCHFPSYLENKLIEEGYKIFFSDDNGGFSSLTSASPSPKPPNPHYQTNRKR